MSNPDKSSQVVTAQISSFIPSIANHPLSVNEADKGEIDLDANDQVETLKTDQETNNLLDSEEIDNLIDLQPEVENIMLTDYLSTTLSTPKHPTSPTPPSTSYLPPKSYLPSTPPKYGQLATDLIPDIQSIDPNLTEDQPTKEQQT